MNTYPSTPKLRPTLWDGAVAALVHIDVSLLLHQELAFPCLRLFLGRKTALQFLLALTAPVSIAKLHIP